MEERQAQEVVFPIVGAGAPAVFNGPMNPFSCDEGLAQIGQNYCSRHIVLFLQNRFL
jgi:hypothetical protein